MVGESSPLLRASNGGRDYDSTRATSIHVGDAASDVCDPSLLRTPACGLSTVEASRRFKVFGPNEHRQPDHSPWKELWRQLTDPLVVVLGAVAAGEAAVGDAVSAIAIGCLILSRAATRWHATVMIARAAAVASASLKPETMVVRDGVHQTIDTARIVPGDRIVLCSGSSVPADCYICDPGVVQVNQAEFSGVSIPITLASGDSAKCGTTIVSGEAEAIVCATGPCTMFAMANSRTSRPSKRVASFEAFTIRFTVQLVAIGIALVALCAGCMLYHGIGMWRTSSFAAVLLATVVPGNMHRQSQLIAALGSLRLANEKITLTRLDAIERLAEMDVLCSDKTGTLTRNKLELQDELPIFYPTANREDVLVSAALATRWKDPPRDAVDTLVLNAIDIRPLDQYTLLEHAPFDPTTKRSESKVRGPTGRIFMATKGSPQVILSLIRDDDRVRDSVYSKMQDLAQRGIRCLAVARCEDSIGEEWKFLGMLTFVDPPRHDSKQAVGKAFELGVIVKVVTGDQRAIALETCRQLGMGTTVITSDMLTLPSDAYSFGEFRNCDVGAIVESVDAIAQAKPHDKAYVVSSLVKRGWRCGVTGSGVNDVPALHGGHIAFAVEGSMDAARSAADIILGKPGLSVVIQAVTLSRDVFGRMYLSVAQDAKFRFHVLWFFTLSILLFRPGGCRFEHFSLLHDRCGDDDHESFETVDAIFSLPIVALVLVDIVQEATSRVTLRAGIVTTTRHPLQWESSQFFLSVATTGIIRVVGSLLLLFWGLDSWNSSGVLRTFGVGKLSFKQIQTLMALNLALTVLLATRQSRPFIRTARWAFKGVVIVACGVIATSLAILWPLSMDRRISVTLSLFAWAFVGIQECFDEVTTCLSLTLLSKSWPRHRYIDEKLSQVIQQQTLSDNRVLLGDSRD